MKMTDSPSPGRRRILKLAGSLTAGLALSTLFLRRAAAALPHLSASTDPAAKALHYTDNARDAAVDHPPMEHCMMCQHYRGRMGEAWGPCEVFPGYAVNAMGWCGAYKAGAKRGQVHFSSEAGKSQHLLPIEK